DRHIRVPAPTSLALWLSKNTANSRLWWWFLSSLPFCCIFGPCLRDDDLGDVGCNPVSLRSLRRSLPASCTALWSCSALWGPFRFLAAARLASKRLSRSSPASCTAACA